MLPILAAINMEDLMNSFRIMGQGMLGIFVVLVVIALIVLLLTKVTNRLAESKKKKAGDTPAQP